jgi:hypothetical protein
MAKIEVSNFKTFNIPAGESIASKFMAPLEVIKKLNGSPIEGTTIEIDDSCLDGNSFYLPPEVQ